MVRKELWAQERSFCGSPPAIDTMKVPKAFVERLTEAVCYAACMAKVELDGVLGSSQSEHFTAEVGVEAVIEVVGMAGERLVVGE